MFNLTTDLIGGITVQTFITGLEGGLAYANIHDANFPGGEIRGQLQAVPGVPGPTVGAGPASFAFAALVLGWLMRRRAHQTV